MHIYPSEVICGPWQSELRPWQARAATVPRHIRPVTASPLTPGPPKMPTHLKELIVVVTIAVLIFRLAKPIALQFSAESDFVRRRRVWLALTVAAFLTPNFWLFAMIAIPLLVWTGRKDLNPAALYLLLLHIIPPMPVRVPFVGISYLFDVDNYLLLSFCVVAPSLRRVLRSKEGIRVHGLATMDVCLITYCVLMSVFYVHQQAAGGALMPTTFTDCLRRAFVFFFGILLPYFLVSRSIFSRRAMLDILATFCLSCSLLAAIAIFESARHWLLYEDMGQRWGVGLPITLYLARGSSLRAMASTGHPLALGVLLAVAFGVWLYLQSHLNSKRHRLAVTALLWLGLFAAYSRGPWICAVFIYFVFAAQRPRAFSALFRAAGIAVIVAIPIALSPLGDKIANVLPVLGGRVDNENIVYRQRLLDRSWQIIKESPFFGDPEALLKMQDLRQGQGIIDLVNSYVEVLLSNGFIGLFLFLSFILIALCKAWALSKQSRRIDPDFSMLGASLVACILGTLLMMADGSFGTGSERIFYVLAGLATGYGYLGRSRQSGPVRSGPNPQRTTLAAPGAD